MPIERDWTHSVAEIPEEGLRVKRRATAAARESLACELELVACERLEVCYSVKPLSLGRFLLKGMLEADVVQTCVVSLDPVETRLVEPFEVEFRPGLEDTPEVIEFDPLETRDIEPMEGDIIPVGRIVYEQLASAVPTHPRKEGAVFEPPASPEADAPDSPFAVLKNLKRQE